MSNFGIHLQNLSVKMICFQAKFYCENYRIRKMRNNIERISQTVRHGFVIISSLLSQQEDIIIAQYEKTW